MRRLDQYLLTHHPLLWNVRVHYIWPAIIVAHLLFFVAGFAPVTVPESLTRYGLYSNEGAVSMAVLSAILLAVSWMVFYFRHNALKKAYPLAKGRLAAEAGLIFLTCLGFTTFNASYQGGRYSHVRMLTAGIDLPREANITNLAHHFLPFNQSEFSQYRDCTYRRDSSDTMATRVDTFSYLHYCGSEVNDYGSHRSTRTPEGNDSIAKSWLRHGRRDSVEWVIGEYLKLTKKYGGSYRFDAHKQAAEVFATPDFLVPYEVYQYDPLNKDLNSYSVSEETTPVEVDAVQNQNAHYRKGDTRYVDDNGISNALYAIAEARQGWLDPGIALFLLYFSLGTALVIFSFRVTAVRTWFIALIGAGIWMAVFGVIGGLFHGGYPLMVVFMVLTILFLGAAIHLIGGRREKGKAGVLYLWALWATPAFLPLLVSFIHELTRPHNDVYDPVLKHYVTPPAPVHEWISSHWPLIGFTNMALFLLMLGGLFIPLARKWQAMAEE